MRKLSVWFIVCYISVGIKAQHNYNFNQLTIRDGLSCGAITCLLQDKKGFIWIGTSDGLNKYDGYQTYVYKHNPQNANSIAGNYIRCLYEDSYNQLWIGQRGGGLTCMEMTTGKITTFQHKEGMNSLSYNDVSGIVEDDDGKLWIAVDRGGLDMFDPKTRTFTNYPLRDENGQELKSTLTDIAIDKHQTIWLAAWGGGIYCFDIKTKTFRVHPEWKTDNNSRCKNIFDIYIDSEDIVWVSSSDDGIYALYPDQTCLHYTVNQDKESINYSTVHSSHEDHEGNIWIATTKGGINIFNKKTGKFTYLISEADTQNGLLSNSINCMYSDNNGTMWVGTSVGVNYYNPLTSQFSFIRKQCGHSLSLSGKEVFSILKDRNNNLWIGGLNGIDIIDPHRKSIKKYPLDFVTRSNTFHHLQAICETRNGDIWIGSYANFLLKYDPVKKSFIQVDIPSPKGMNLSYRNVYAIYEDWDHSIWLSTEFGAINYHPATGVFESLFNKKSQIIYPDEKIYVIYRDEELELWVGTEAGLLRYSRDLKIREIYVRNDENPFSITNDHITTILEDSKGIFWIGTMGGLHRMDKKEKKFELIKRPDVTYGDPVFGLCEDKNGILWMSTTTGIIKLNPENMTFNFYDASDGLQNKDFLMRAFYQSEDGELFFGGQDGLNAFYPENLKTNEQKPFVVINDFQIFNKSVVPEENGILKRMVGETDEIRIKHSQSVISFSFVALNYVSPSKNRYKYQMTGFDKDWVTANPGQRSVTYTNLNPGEYVFKVIA